jgi:hypothetical protein
VTESMKNHDSFVAEIAGAPADRSP